MWWLVHLLVALLPSGFREAFGDEVIEQVTEEVRRAQPLGWRAVWRVKLSAVGDLAWCCVSERFRPSWTRTESRSSGGGEGMMEWMRDLRLAGRTLRASPGFAATVVLTLGLAIGVNAAIFTVADEVLVDPLRVPDGDRVVHLGSSAPGSDLPEEFNSAGEFYVEYSKLDDLFESVATYNWFTATFRTQDRTERVPMSSPSVSLFETLGVTAAIGRLPTLEDDGTTAVLSHQAFVDWFGADEGVIGRSYQMMGQSRVVVGVMPPGFSFPRDDIVVWAPGPEMTAERVQPGRFGLNLAARLRPGVPIEVLAPRLDAVARRIPEQYGVSGGYAQLLTEQFRAVVRPLSDEIFGSVTGPLRILMAAVAIVLLIACANVTNLFLVRAERRRLDYAIRSAIGAGRSALARAQFAEVILAAVVAGVLAVGIAATALPALVRMAPAGLPGLAEAKIGVGTVVFTFVLTLAVAVLCGAGPTIRTASVQARNAGLAARGGARGTHWGRNGLVVLQTAMAVVLLVGSGLLMRSFQELRAVDPGYDVEDVFTFQIAIEDEPGMEEGPDFARFHLDFMDRLRALPGVETVGIVENVPLNEGVRSMRFAPADVTDEDAGTQLGQTFAGGDYFEAMGIEVLRGRVFAEGDHLENPGYAILSERAGELLFPGQDPVGQRFRWVNEDRVETVIGVVEDVRQSSFREEGEALVYFPMVGQTADAWRLSSPAYVVKSERAGDIAPEIRAMAREVAPSAPMYRTFTMEGLADDSMVALSFALLVIGVASALALVLGTVGLYGVLSYVVTERAGEIGVRMALGAEAGRVRRMVVERGLRVVALGVVIGAVAAALASRALGSLLYGIDPFDTPTFVGVVTLLLLVGALASYIPARRASSIDPVRTLRAG